MAIFYNHIKGCGSNATGKNAVFKGHSEDSGVTSGWERSMEYWGWIDWESYIYRTESDQLIKPHVLSVPKIRINISNDKASAIDCGHIITSDALYQYITNDFEFKNSIACKGALEVTGNISSNNSLILGYGETGNASSIIGIDRRHHLALKNQSAVWFFNDDANTDLAISPHSWGDYGAIYKNNDDFLIIESSAKDSSGDNFTRQPTYFATSQLTVENKNNDTELIVKGKCEALYFNATSDRRAKTNITPAEFSALHVVNSIPTYTFNYNNKEEKTIGLIAQEAAELNLDGFNMVDNLEATGVDGDFMQMKESKLVYILWKAVQELSAEVEELKAEIRNLK